MLTFLWTIRVFFQLFLTTNFQWRITIHWIRMKNLLNHWLWILFESYWYRYVFLFVYSPKFVILILSKTIQKALTSNGCCPHWILILLILLLRLLLMTRVNFDLLSLLTQMNCRWIIQRFYISLNQVSIILLIFKEFFHRDVVFIHVWILHKNMIIK